MGRNEYGIHYLLNLDPDDCRGDQLNSVRKAIAWLQGIPFS